MASPLGIVFLGTVAALAGGRIVAAALRSNARWARYLRSVSVAKVPTLPFMLFERMEERRRKGLPPKRLRLTRREPARRSAAGVSEGGQAQPVPATPVTAESRPVQPELPRPGPYHPEPVQALPSLREGEDRGGQVCRLNGAEPNGIVQNGAEGAERPLVKKPSPPADTEPTQPLVITPEPTTMQPPTPEQPTPEEPATDQPTERPAEQGAAAPETAESEAEHHEAVPPEPASAAPVSADQTVEPREAVTEDAPAEQTLTEEASVEGTPPDEATVELVTAASSSPTSSPTSGSEVPADVASRAAEPTPPVEFVIEAGAIEPAAPEEPDLAAGSDPRPGTHSERLTGTAAADTSDFPHLSPAGTLPRLGRPGEVRIGLIGGSGLGQAMAARAEGRRHELDTPFGRPSDAIVETEWAGLPVYVLSRHGPGHVLNPSQVPYRANLFALKQLGVTHVIASGAVGSLRDHYKPRDLVIADQVIDKTSKRANTFYERAAVHVEFAEPFCPVLRRILIEAGQSSEFRGQSSGGEGGETPGASAASSSELQTLNSELSPFSVHDRGCYVCMEGPAFSTRAESLMHRLWGGDLIGMTAMPEAKLAREAEMSYALVALVTDYDSWRRPGTPRGPGQVEQPSPPAADPDVLLKEIIANLQAATDNGIRLIRRAVELMAARTDELNAAPALQALRLAIWSDKSRIAPDEVQRLGPLWMKYFEQQ